MIQPRVGHINFLNILPLTYSYDNGYSAGLELKYAVPSILNNDIKTGQLDISHISSIEYAKQSAELLMLPDICIRSDADVESIVLVSKKPINKITNDKIIMTAKSSTSHCLLKIIMSESYGAAPQYQIDHIGLNNLIPGNATASLFIGDDALHIYHNKPDNLYLYDLGREWHKLTGRSMVYAVWTVRRKFAEEFPDVVHFAYDKIMAGLREGLKNKAAAINSVIGQKDFSFDVLNNYLGSVIKWDLTDYHIQSLKLFYKMAYKLELIEHNPNIEFIR